MNKKASGNKPAKIVAAPEEAVSAPAAEEQAAAAPVIKKVKPQEASVTFAGAEARVFDALRTRLGADGTRLKKSVLLRAALAALAEAGDERAAALVAGLAPVKAA